MTTNVLNKPLLVILLAIGCFVFFLYMSLLSSNYEQVEKDVRNYISQWEYEISESIFYNKNSNLVRKIADGLENFQLSSYEIMARGNTIYSWPSKSYEISCRNSIEDTLTLNGLHFGKIRLCISDHSVISDTLLSPIFILVILVVMILLFLVSFLSLFGYKKSLNSTLYLLKNWNNKSDSSLPESNDKITNEIVGLVRKGLELRTSLEDVRLSLTAEKDMSRIIKQVAHDIKNPVQELSALMFGKFDPEIKERIIRSSIIKIDETCQSLLSKNIANRYMLEQMRPTKVSELIDEIIKNKSILYKNIQFKTNIEEAQALCSPIGFKRVFSNLLTNSIEAVPSNRAGVISCSVRIENQICKITLEDNGKGISEENLHRVFEESFTSGKSLGNGLGLYYAKQKAKEWGGTIEVRSEINKKTIIDLVLRVPPKKEAKKKSNENLKFVRAI